MFEVLATSRRRSILGFRLPLGFCKGFSLKTNLSRKAKPFGVIPNGFALLFYCVSCFQAAFAMLKGSLKCLRYAAALRNLHRRKRFDHVVHGFHARKEVFQLGERQGGCAVAFGLAGVGVAF